MAKVKAVWTGEFPCLCHGEWKLSVDGADVSDLIPEELRYDPMYTFGSYPHWYWDEDGYGEWEYVTNGKKKDEWIEENAAWLGNIPADPGDIFDAFNAADFRLNSCGGCI